MSHNDILSVLSLMFQAFSDAYNLLEMSEQTSEISAPYVIQNDSGLVITLKLDESGFKVKSTSELFYFKSVSSYSIHSK